MAKDNSALIIGIIAALIVLGTVIYFSDFNSTNVYQYSNGDSIFDVNVLNEVETQIRITIGDSEEAYILNLRNDPLSLEDISVTGNIAQRIINDQEIYIVINPNAGLSSKATIAALEIDKIIDNQFFYNIPVSSAMTEEYGEYPIVTCDMANDEYSVIYLGVADETAVYVDGYCIIVEGADEDDLIRAADRLSLHLLGIMS
ncbi:hypothetical protein HOE07_04285 [archaeon]|jgi:hypothetical protein|nr:hypothetical protein [archaeon]